MKQLFLATLLAVFLASGFAGAQDGADTLAVHAVISNQIEAFRNDDGERAYSFAAPNIKRLFPTPGRFMQMVEKGYEPVYRPRSFSFLDLDIGADKAVQLVDVVGPDGSAWIAMYTLQRLEDGNWKITGCRLKPGVGA